MLTGARILLTRPADQAHGLIALLTEQGARVLHRPTLAIAAQTPDAASLIDAPDWVVFTSPNAVRFGLPWLAAQTLEQANVGAVGPSTAAALIDHGVAVRAAPAIGGGAQALLAEPAFALHEGERVQIVRGQGGRRVLAKALHERGIAYYEVVVYARTQAAATLSIPTDWYAQALDYTVITSVSGLTYLFGMVEQAALEWIQRSQLITVSQRIAERARSKGFDRVVVANGADDQAISQAIMQTWRQRKP